MEKLKVPVPFSLEIGLLFNEQAVIVWKRPNACPSGKPVCALHFNNITSGWYRGAGCGF